MHRKLRGRSLKG